MTKSKVLNYSTTVEASRTVSQIEDILQKAGVRRISKDMLNSQIEAIRFTLTIRDREVWFELRTKSAQVYDQMLAGYKNRYRVNKKALMEQADRVAWRILKDWVEAQLALVQLDQMEMSEAFFTKMLSPSGKTIYEEFSGGNLLPPGAASGEVIDAEYRSV